MNSAWKRELRQRGAVVDGDRIRTFGSPDGELAALATGTTLHPLSEDALIGVQGQDAEAFLQSQLTVDVGSVDPHHARMAAYCSPKGRVIATALVWLGAQGYTLQLPREVADPLRARLQRYVLRSRAALADTSALSALIGVGGPAARELVAEVVGNVPKVRFARAQRAGAAAVTLADDLICLALDPASAPEVWDRLAAGGAIAGGSEGWEWRKIAAGLPTVTALTQEQFVPQMLGLDALGAVSFEKGCYPGQEIIARSQYLGEVKRRLFAYHDPSASAVAGSALYVAGTQSSVGSVVNAASAPSGGLDLLAVVASEHAEHSSLCVGHAQGPPLAFTRAVQAVASTAQAS